MTRQNYYKERTRRQRREIAESLILDLVAQERAMQPKLGGRKLLHMIAPELASAGVSVGRDRLFALLAEHNLLTERTIRGPRWCTNDHENDDRNTRGGGSLDCSNNVPGQPLCFLIAIGRCC